VRCHEQHAAAAAARAGNRRFLVVRRPARPHIKAPYKIEFLCKTLRPLKRRNQPGRARTACAGPRRHTCRAGTPRPVEHREYSHDSLKPC
jgi:hypothetical protein